MERNINPWVVIVVLVALMVCLELNRSPVEERYGFEVSTPRLSLLRNVEVLMISSIDSSGIFNNSGFHELDVIVYPRFRSVSRFFKYLDQPTGTEIHLDVIKLSDLRIDDYINNACETHRICFLAP